MVRELDVGDVEDLKVYYESTQNPCTSDSWKVVAATYKNSRGHKRYVGDHEKVKAYLEEKQ